MIKFFVEVDNENFKFRVKTISHKTFCVCEDMLRAEKICSLLNSNTPKRKQEYILLLVSCGVFDSYTNCKNITKDILQKKYNKIIQKYEKSIKSIYKIGNQKISK